MSSGIVGREQELDRLRALLDRPAEGVSALVLEGEPGIGKSTLWLAGVELARERGFLILSSRPAEAERGLAQLGLADLLEGVVDDVLPALASPRRRALEAALLLEDDPDETVDQRAVAVAVRDVLRLLAQRGPLLVAVDDVQWLDPSSARALAPALRRLAADGVLLLLARRLDGTPPSPVELALVPERIERLPVGPLSVGALHQLLRDRLGGPFARQTLLRIHERSGGNPFFALELARVLDAAADPLELPVPETLEEVVRGRLSELPDATLQALALISAMGSSSDALLERAGVAPEALKPAFAAHVIERENGTLRFSHPLLSSVLYQDLGQRQRGVHGRIAEIVDDPLARARHLALSRGTPDADVARRLDAAAASAIDRGAAAVAAELAEHALRLTPPDERDERHRRTLTAARAQHAAGEWPRAQALATDLVGEPDVGSLRAEALVFLAELEGADRSVELLEEALHEADSRPALCSVIHCRLAWAKRFAGGLEHADAALELAEELEDDVLGRQAEVVQTILSWFAGETESPPDLLVRGHEFAMAVGGEQLVQEATLAIANTFAPEDRRDEARALFEDEYREWCERNEPRGARALWGLSWVELWAGRWELAAEYAERAKSIAIQYALEVPQDHLPIAVIAVHRGQLDLAREHSTRALELAIEQFGFHPPQHLAVMGLAALWSGDQSAAEDWLNRADQHAAQLDWNEPSVRWWTADRAELLLELGRIEDATRLVDRWDADAARLGREWVSAHVTRSRGLIAAAEGDVDGALALLEQAVARHGEVGDPYGRARAMLALGVVSRRARRKRAAREAIGEALGGFEQLGAAMWADRARNELGSIGGRVREEGLTAAERRVAVLVAEGQTNREVAAALFLGERTVASHLTHIYAKLGIRSRTELARVLD